MYDLFCRDFTKYTGMYGAHIRFWPTLCISMNTLLTHLQWHTWSAASICEYALTHLQWHTWSATNTCLALLTAHVICNNHMIQPHLPREACEVCGCNKGSCCCCCCCCCCPDSFSWRCCHCRCCCCCCCRCRRCWCWCCWCCVTSGGCIR